MIFFLLFSHFSMCFVEAILCFALISWLMRIMFWSKKKLKSKHDVGFDPIFYGMSNFNELKSHVAFVICFFFSFVCGGSHNPKHKLFCCHIQWASWKSHNPIERIKMAFFPLSRLSPLSISLCLQVVLCFFFIFNVWICWICFAIVSVCVCVLNNE